MIISKTKRKNIVAKTRRQNRKNIVAKTRRKKIGGWSWPFRSKKIAQTSTTASVSAPIKSNKSIKDKAKKHNKQPADPVDKTNSCVGVRSVDDVKSKFDMYVKILGFNPKISSARKIKILPYCGELLKIKFGLDYANKSSIETNIIDLFKAPFNIDFEYDSPIISKPDIKSSEYSPEKFMSYMGLMAKGTYFIISHSNFMFNLFNILPITNRKADHTIAYNNLEIMKISDGKCSNYFIENNIYIEQEIFKIDNNKFNLTGKTIYIMRHCFACHNTEKGGIKKIHRFIKKEQGFLKYSMCLQQTTINNMKVRVKSLYNLITSDGSTSFDKIIFCSSVIFRAILTCVLQYNVLNNYKLNQSNIALSEGEKEIMIEGDVE